MSSSIRYARIPDSPPNIPPAAARAGDLVFVGGALAAHPSTGVPEEVKPLRGYARYGSNIERQLDYVYGRLSKQLDALGSRLPDMLKINSYHTDPSDADMALRVRKRWFDVDAPPPSTLVTVPELPVHGPAVVVDAVTLAADSPYPREPISIKSVPTISHVAATGWAPFSQAVRGGGFIFTRGTVAASDKGPLEETLTHSEFRYRRHQIRFQAEYVLDYISRLLADAECSMSDVIKAEIHLRDMRDLVYLDEVWEESFPSDFPARTVLTASPPIDSIVIEVEVIAVDPAGPYTKQVVRTDDAPTPLGPVSQAVKAGPYVFLSGQLATDHETGLAPEAQPVRGLAHHHSAVREQVVYICRNAEAICQAAGTSMANVVKRRVHHLDLGDMPIAEHYWMQMVGDSLPPTTTFRVKGPFAVPDCVVQYDLTAYAPA